MVNHELSVAITKALILLGYMELPDDDQPDEKIWNHPEKLEEWFDMVKERRKNPNMEKVPNSPEEYWEGQEYDQNELTAGLRPRG